MTEDKRIGFIGLGAMGMPMAQQVLAKHGRLTVYDVDADAVRRLAGEGATADRSPREVGEDSDIVITMLPHPDVLRDVVNGDDGLLAGMSAGSTLIDMSTNGLAIIKEVGGPLRDKGVKLVDAPVGKGPWAAEKGDLTIMMGGDAADCEAVRWVLEMMGSKVYHCGPLGAGQAIKLANNLASCANMSVAAEAYALAKAAGADLDVLMEVMPQTSADSWQLRNTLIKKVLNNDFSPMFKLGLARKDMRLIAEMADDLAVNVPCARASLEGYDQAADAGHGDLDWGAVILNSNPELKKTE